MVPYMGRKLLPIFQLLMVPWLLTARSTMAAQIEHLASGAHLENSFCLDCHSDKTLTKTNANGKEISLFINTAKLSASVHKTNTCISCHSDLTTKHPDDNLAVRPVNCSTCHHAQSETYATS